MQTQLRLLFMKAISASPLGAARTSQVTTNCLSCVGKAIFASAAMNPVCDTLQIRNEVTVLVSGLSTKCDKSRVDSKFK